METMREIRLERMCNVYMDAFKIFSNVKKLKNDFIEYCVPGHKATIEYEKLNKRFRVLMHRLKKLINGLKDEGAEKGNIARFQNMYDELTMNACELFCFFR